MKFKDIKNVCIATLAMLFIAIPVFMIFTSFANAAASSSIPYGREEKAVVLQAYRQEDSDRKTIEITLETTNGENLRNTFEFSSDSTLYPDYWDTRAGDVVNVTVTDIVDSRTGEILTSEISNLEEVQT